MKKALLDIIRWAPEHEPPDRFDPDTDETVSTVFDGGVKFGLWLAAKRAKEALGK